MNKDGNIDAPLFARQFLRELDLLINRYTSEYTATYEMLIGCLEKKKLDIYGELRENSNLGEDADE